MEPSAHFLVDGTWAEFSPNGRYLAYTVDESGRREVFVRPFPQVDRGRWQISTAGGTRPAWARNGRELFYLDASNTLTAVPVQTSGSTFSRASRRRCSMLSTLSHIPHAITTCRPTVSDS